jgi:2-polyprenyl-3-methyl-5-hydroxy-6-metoxy-1,4-benzoquinol methylase
MDRGHLIPGTRVYTSSYFDGTTHEKTGGGLGYPASYADRGSSYRSRYYDRYAVEIGGLLRGAGASHPRVLDVGCAFGGFLQYLSRTTSAEVHGVEIDPEVCRIASENLNGAPVYCVDLKKEQGVIPRDAFDVVTLLDVIEHVDDPRSYLAALLACCRPGGYLLLSTPNIESLNARMYGSKWILHTPPYHTCYFGPKSLSLLLKQTGWDTVSFFTERTIFHNERTELETWRGRLARFLFDRRPCDFLTNEILKIGSIMIMIARRPA